MSKHTYHPPVNDARRDYAFAKARNRGEASVKWHETNKLTPETLPAFKAAMKKADKEFDKTYKK